MQISSIAGNSILERSPWAAPLLSSNANLFFIQLYQVGVCPPLEQPASCSACQFQCHMTKIPLFFLLSPYLCSCSLLIQNAIPLHLESWEQGKIETMVSCCLSGPKSSFRDSQDILPHLPLSYKIHLRPWQVLVSAPTSSLASQGQLRPQGRF